ncbi:MAG TPA: hypothetical protein DCS28_02745 [Candidatus Moranbacteria bacterium]|nr:hypothetical protein [Candidatus Moranbacteria bacterium]HAT74934.1 hypothetical protein [Candidatus Moranbacteria bacterium]
MKNLVKKNTSRERDQFAVVLEDINSKINLLVESHQSLADEFRSFKIETKENFKAVFEYFSRIDDELQDIKAEIKSLKIEFKDKIELERVIVLERKVSMLEKILIKQKLLSV